MKISSQYGKGKTDMLFRIAFLFTFVLFWGIRGYYVRKTKFGKKSRSERLQAIREEGKASSFLLLVVFWIYIIIAAMYLLDLDIIAWSYIPLITELRALGVILGSISIAYVFWAHHVLRENYSAMLETSQEQKLIKEGPYGRIRHPIYSAHVLLDIALVFISGNWLLLLIFIISMPFTYKRIFNEEKMMIEEFGEEYENYMKETGRLFPKIP